MSRPKIAGHVMTTATSTCRQEPRVQAAQTASKPAGNFGDCESLFERLESGADIGRPAPNSKFQDKKRVGRCPASHNRALLD